jgi:hypothetical protein
LTSGLLLVAVGLALLTQLPAHGHYFWDLFPSALVSGIGMAFTFVPMTIAGLTGVERADAGVASGLINTTRQVGGAVGLAAVSAIAISSTDSGLTTSLTGSFHTAFEILTGLALLGAAVAIVFLAPSRRAGATVPSFEETDLVVPMEEAATDSNHHIDGENLLAHEIDDLLLRARGLVLVRDLLAERGATRTEIDAHSNELERVRTQLAGMIRGSEDMHFGEAA